MLLTDDFLKHWENIVDQVDKEHVPIECVKKIIFRTQDRRQRTINLRRLRDQGAAPAVVQNIVDKYIRENEQYIASMEFVLDIEAVAQRLQPETDKLLKGIQ